MTKQDAKKKVMELLQKEQRPIGPAEIAEKMGLKSSQRSTIHAYLKELTREGLVKKIPETGQYALVVKHELEDLVLKRIAKGRVNGQLVVKELTKGGRSADEVESVLESLYLRNYIEPDPLEDKTIPRTVLDHEYSLTPDGANRIGVCIGCGEPVGDEDMALVSMTMLESPPRLPLWHMHMIHASCFVKAQKNVVNDEFLSEGLCCRVCGLPITPAPLQHRPVHYLDIYDHLTKQETEILDAIEDRWYDRMTLLVALHVDKNVDEMTEIIPIPEAVLERDVAKRREELTARDYKQREKYIVEEKRLSELMKTDLSSRANAEYFLESLDEFSKKHLKAPYNGDLKTRSKELWKAAKSKKEEWNKVIDRAYEFLSGPVGSVYQTLSPMWVRGAYSTIRTPLRPMKMRREKGSDEENIINYTDFIRSDQSLAVVKGDRLVHPFCVQQLKGKEVKK